MNVTKTYAAKSSVTRAIKAAGLNPADYTIVEVEGGFAGHLDTATVYGYSDHGQVVCPHCGIHLSNGVGEDGQEVNDGYVYHDKFQYACLGCGGEFGPAISRKAKKEPTGATKPRNGNCRKTWEIAESMVGARRRDVIAACVEAGINLGTAKTQYQQWFASKRG